MSEINPFVVPDYLGEARDRVTEQFKNKDVIDRYLQLLIQGQVDLIAVYKDLMQLRSIDTATGEQLDLLGRIVGQDRVLLNTDLFTFFGFTGATKAGTFGDVTNELLGSNWWDLNAPIGGNTLLDDQTYRLFIKAKIYKNVTASTPEEFISVINLILGTNTTYLMEQGNANVIVLIGKLLTDFEKVLLTYISYNQGYPSRLIPKTVGVGIGFGEFDGASFFAFDGVPNAKGFGNIGSNGSSGAYGYGLGYGLKYGDSDYTTEGYYVYDPSYDGSWIYDGGETYNPTKTLVSFGEPGGAFATLF